jgi:hypothetical protein
MATKKSQLSNRPARYNFVFNPYPDMRCPKCPFCEQKTGQRKLPLLIHVDPLTLIALNYTCKFCSSCDLLIAHKHQVEYLLTNLFLQMDPEVIGNDYIVLGTVDKIAWRKGQARPLSVAEMLPYASDFKAVYPELRMTQPGYFEANCEPPIWEPPPSQEWVKSESK